MMGLLGLGWEWMRGAKVACRFPAVDVMDGFTVHVRQAARRFGIEMAFSWSARLQQVGLAVATLGGCTVVGTGDKAIGTPVGSI